LGKIEIHRKLDKPEDQILALSQNGLSKLLRAMVLYLYGGITRRES